MNVTSPLSVSLYADLHVCVHRHADPCEHSDMCMSDQHLDVSHTQTYTVCALCAPVHIVTVSLHKLDKGRKEAMTDDELTLNNKDVMLRLRHNSEQHSGLSHFRNKAPGIYSRRQPFILAGS